MKSFSLGILTTLAIVAAFFGVFKANASTLLEAILSTTVISIQQDVPVTAQVYIPLDTGETVTATVPLTINVDLKIGISTPLSLTVDSRPISTDGATLDGQSEGNATDLAATIDLSDPLQVAAAILHAYGNKDLPALLHFTSGRNREFVEEFMELDADDPELEELYSGWRWEAVEEWDGELQEVRYFTRGDEVIAEVHFADMGSDEIATVALFPEDGLWYFEDIHSPSPERFAEGDEAMP